MTFPRRTLLLTVPDIRQLIGTVGIGPLTKLLADQIRGDFLRWSEFKLSPRYADYLPDGVIELMPTSDGAYFCFKYVNGHPQNLRLGLSTVMGFGCLSDVHTGWPLLLCEMTLLTAVRTAATSTVAAQALANPGAKRMALVGNGSQSEFQAVAFHEVLGIERINLFDIDPSATRRLMSNLAGRSGLELTPQPSAEAAVEDADIVTTSTAKRGRFSVLSASMVRPGMHVNAIGGDAPGKTEISPEVLAGSKVFVEYEPQTRMEGDIQQMPPEFPVTELWEVLTGAKPGRTSKSEITLFDSVGFSIEDHSTLHLVYELAKTHGVGTAIDLVPEMSDPRDLFGMLV